MSQLPCGRHKVCLCLKTTWTVFSINFCCPQDEFLTSSQWHVRLLMIWPLLTTLLSSLLSRPCTLQPSHAGRPPPFHLTNSCSPSKWALLWYLLQEAFSGSQVYTRCFISVFSEYLIVTPIRNFISLQYGHLFLSVTYVQGLCLVIIGKLPMLHICFLKEKKSRGIPLIRFSQLTLTYMTPQDTGQSSLQPQCLCTVPFLGMSPWGS